MRTALYLRGKHQIRFFLLKWTKNCIPLEHKANNSNLSEDSCVQDLTVISYLLSLSKYKISVLAYIGGFIIRLLSKSLLCKTCYHVLVKDQCGLLHPSEDVLKIL